MTVTIADLRRHAVDVARTADPTSKNHRREIVVQLRQRLGRELLREWTLRELIEIADWAMEGGRYRAADLPAGSVVATEDTVFIARDRAVMRWSGDDGDAADWWVDGLLAQGAQVLRVGTG